MDLFLTIKRYKSQEDHRKGAHLETGTKVDHPPDETEKSRKDEASQWDRNVFSNKDRIDMQYEKTSSPPFKGWCDTLTTSLQET